MQSDFLSSTPIVMSCISAWVRFRALAGLGQRLGQALPGRTACLFLVALAWAAHPASAQMRSGEQMKNYESVFDLKIGQRSYPYDVVLVESKPAGNVLAPGEQPSFSFLVKNNLTQPIQAGGHIDVISYGTRGIPGDIWLPELYKVADLPKIAVQVNIPAGGSQLINVTPDLPAKFGAYALVMDLGAQGRRFATTCVRTFASAPEKIQYPKLSLDDSVGADVLNRLGVQAVRMSVLYVPSDSKNYAVEMAKLDEKLQAFASKNITVMLMFLSGADAPQPLGRGRPHLDANGVMLNTKQDLAWLPSSDADFQKFVATICRKYGWPRGPVTAAELWNEPWDGISISGWGADIPRFRELYTAMAQAVEEARKAGASILLAGCDSSTNTLDKFFPDGKDTFMKWFDVCTIHYQGLCAPVLYRDWINRKGPNGRVKIWDTESWVANTDDRVATIVAADRAAGYDRSMGVYGGNISTEVKQNVVLPGGTRKQVDTFHAWSTAASVGAAQHFIGERNFRELLFKNSLPWVMVFDGLNGKEDDGTVVIAGDLTEEFGDFLPLQGVRGMAEIKEKEELAKQLAALPADSPERETLQKKLTAKTILSGATLTLQNPGKEFILYDSYGNPIAGGNGAITVPLDQRGFFLRTNGTAGSFKRLTKAINESRIDGYEPLNVIAHDLLAPVGQKPSLRLSLTNILNRPVSGSLKITLGQLQLDVPAKLDLAAHETRELLVPITDGTAALDNTYPLDFRFDAGADGCAIHRENLHVNYIAKKTIQVDGSLDDWKDVLPQPVIASGNQGPSLMESAWLPFAKFKTEQKSGFATGYLAYDENNFYFAAKIADSTPSAGTLRYEKRDDDAYFYPQTSYEYDPGKTLLKSEETWHQALREKGALFLPDSTTKRSFTAWTSVSTAFAIDFDLPTDVVKKLSFYFVDWDDYKTGRRVEAVEVHDLASGKLLADTHVHDFGTGCYASFLVSGKVRVVFRSLRWLNAALSGVFLDVADGPAPASGGAFAKFQNFDFRTGGAWQGKYGQEGYLVIGAPPSYPTYAKVTVPEIVEKKEHKWPEGVRRYSYRRRPELPFGSSPNKFDNVQIAFNVIPMEDKPDMIPCPPGTMPGFVPHSDTDYEYALNQVADTYGGGVEIWRSFAPGMPRKSDFPRQPKSPFDGAVKGGRLAVKYDDNTRIVEAAIPWSEIPLVKKAMEAGKPIKFSFRVNDNEGPSMELAEGRSVSKKNPFAFHPDWVEHWANEVEFAFEK